MALLNRTREQVEAMREQPMNDEPEADAISLAMFVDSLRACSDPTKRRAADVIERLRGEINALKARTPCTNLDDFMAVGLELDAGHKAYVRGYETADLLSNPYPDGSLAARRFVDGWTDGRKWKRAAGVGTDCECPKVFASCSDEKCPRGKASGRKEERTPGVCTCGMGPISGCWKCD